MDITPNIIKFQVTFKKASQNYTKPKGYIYKNYIHFHVWQCDGRGPETQIPSVRLSRSWNLDPVRPSVRLWQTWHKCEQDCGPSGTSVNERTNQRMTFLDSGGEGVRP
jgi:hypothetical protein